jgi:predicted phosphodiesterase
MKIVAMSDMHGYLPAEVPECDLLLLAGDLTPVHDHDPLFQARWLRNEFREWLDRLPARKIVGVAGNHDFVFEQAADLVPRDLPWTYLQDSSIEWEGLKIWGTPWQPIFFDWAFNGDPAKLKRQWDLIPEGTDILLLHGPPYGYGDGVPDGASFPLSPEEGRGVGVRGVRRCGCPHLLDRIRAIQPRLAVFGHIHEGRGQWQLGRTTLANVTLLDAAYRAVYEPWVWELDSSS